MFGSSSAHLDLSLNRKPARCGCVAIFSMAPSSLPPRGAHERGQQDRQQDGRYHDFALFRLSFCRSSAEARLFPDGVSSRLGATLLRVRAS